MAPPPAEEVQEVPPEREMLLRARVGAFTTYQKLEVERSDGRWTGGAICEDYDEYGDTYTVRLSDGRLKYFVERRSLREVRVGSLAHGKLVRLALHGRTVYGTVDDYDAECELYNLRLVASGQFRLVADDEIQTVALDAL